MKQGRFFLFAIFFLAFFLRVYHLGTLPKTFYVEELTNTYVGKFILLYGKDINGHPLPLIYFDKFGDYPPVLPFYLSGLSAIIFGTNEFAGRLPIAIIGALLVFPMFDLAYLFFRNRKTGLFAAFVAAVIPWHIVLSRTTAEGVVGLTVWAYAIAWILRGIEEKNTKLIWRSFAFFFLSYFLYPALRILVPFTLLPLPYLTWKSNKKITTLLFGAIVVFGLLTAGIASTKWGRSRFEQTSLFASPEIKQSIALRNKILSDGLGPNNVMRARIFHNKATGYIREFLNQYFSYFSPKYLFFEMGSQYRYYNVPDQGLLFIAFLPFFLAAFIPIAKSRRSLLTYVVYLLAVSPIPAALTVDFTPHAHRSIFMILPLGLVAASGFCSLLTGGLWKKGIITLSFVLVLFEFIYFWNQYAFQADSFQSTLRNDGDKAAALYMKEVSKNYDQIYAPIYDRFAMYYLFYTNNFSRSLAGTFHDEMELDHFDNITFVKSWCPSKLDLVRSSQKNILLFEKEECASVPGFSIIKTITRMDGTVDFLIRKPVR